MTRVRFDPSFVEDERWERLGADAFTLHVVACSYAVRTLSDGILTAARVRTLTPLVADCAGIAEQLVADGLWEQLDDGRLRVCQVRDDLRHADGRGDEQPSRTFVEKERERARVRKENWRSKKNAGVNGEGNVVPIGVRNTPQSSADQSSAVQDPKGPDPALHTAERGRRRAPHQACEHGRRRVFAGDGSSSCESCDAADAAAAKQTGGAAP